MDTRNVLQFVRPFDPLSPDAEDAYDAVVRRVNSIRHRRSQVARELAEIEHQFVEGDFIIRSGPQSRQSLSRNERRSRLVHLLELGTEFSRLNAEEQFALANLDRMNEELDRWARETYGA